MKEPKWIFGFCLLFAIVALAFVLALGKVDEATSYGLHEILLILTVIATKWCDDVFGGRAKPSDSPQLPDKT